MKKSTISLTLCALLLMLVMYNCKNKDADPLSLDQGMLDKLKAIKMADVELQAPKPVVSTDGTVDLSAKSLDLNADITALGATGVANAGLIAAAEEISNVLTPAETAMLANLKPEVLTAYAKGGAIPANIKAILDKAGKSAVMASRQPIVVLPTVSGAVVAGRIGAGEPAPVIEKLTSTLISDECIALAEAAFQLTKNQLDATRDAQLAAADLAFSNASSTITNNLTTCNTTQETKYAALLTKAETQFNTMSALLAAREAALGPVAYANLSFQVFMQYFTYSNSIASLEIAAKNACQQIYTAGINNATAAKTANYSATNAAYTQAIADAIIARDALAEQCHNQGGGI